MLQLTVEIANHAESVIELRRKKHFPTEDDLNPNKRFVNSRVIHQFRINEALNKQLSQSKLSWTDEPELIKKLYTLLIESDFLRLICLQKENTYQDDKKLIENLFAEVYPSI